MADLRMLAERFALSGKVSDVEPLGEGFINDTYKVYLVGRQDPSYILQRKNHKVFPDIPAMMENIRQVTEHIKKCIDNPERGTLTVIPTVEGDLYYKDESGDFWAMCKFIPGSRSYERADTPEIARQGGLGLGVFHRQVADFKAPLTEVIKGFHNIRFRLSQWDEVVAKDPVGRVARVKEEISWVESRRKEMLAFWEKYEKGLIPTRVTHNDTKISNFLFDDKTGELLCAIDLDTLMSSTLLNDIGDALRSYTNTGAEDDENTDRVSMSFDMFKAYMDGYLSQMKDCLTSVEIENLAFSGLYIIYEQVLRFLMDYIDGDNYYKVKSPEHNLIRTRAQYKLLTSMEKQLSEMNAFIASLIS